MLFEEGSNLASEDTLAVVALAMDDQDFSESALYAPLYESAGDIERLLKSIAVQIERIVNLDLLRILAVELRAGFRTVRTRMARILGSTRIVGTARILGWIEIEPVAHVVGMGLFGSRMLPGPRGGPVIFPLVENLAKISHHQLETTIKSARLQDKRPITKD